jgi:O-acetyl-ADP-ribose deacetylase (regulator of RNase III)
MINFIFFDINKNNIEQYQKVLENKIPNSIFLCDDLESLIKKYPINCIVSPANSYGFMNGGIDKVINKIFNNIEPLVQYRIKQVGFTDNSERYFLPVGYCEVVQKDNLYLFVAPTMTMPGKIISGSKNVENAFFAILKQIEQMVLNGINIINIACPCLGTGVGQMDPTVSAMQIRDAVFLYYYSKN